MTSRQRRPRLYARTVQLNPDSGLADDALWWRGRILEDDKKLDDARRLYERLLKDYPASSWAKDAAFRRGLLQYRAGKYREAANAWGEALPNVLELEDRQRLAFWRGKALLKANDRPAPRLTCRGWPRTPSSTTSACARRRCLATRTASPRRRANPRSTSTCSSIGPPPRPGSQPRRAA